MNQRAINRGMEFSATLWVILIACLFVILLASCATVNDPDYIQPEDESGPDISPTLLAPDQNILKRRVAIARFSNETPYGKSILLGDKKSMIGSMTSDILASRLTQSGKFLLFERSDSDRIIDALNRSDLESINLPADYLIIGSLSEFGRNTIGETGVFSRSKVQKAHARVNVRLVDVKTSQVIYSEEGAGEASTEVGTMMGVGTKAGYDATLDSKAISAAISMLVSNIVENLMSRPWRSYLLSRDGENIVIAGGVSQGLEAGEQLALVKLGKKVKNPQTGMQMELPGVQVGLLEIISLFGNTPESEGAICKVVSGTLPQSESAFSQYVVEEIKQ